MFHGTLAAPRPALWLVWLAAAALIGGLVMPPAGRGPQPVPALRTTGLPLLFEPNAGQTDPSVAFLARGLGGTLFFRAGEVVLSLPAGSPRPRPLAERSSRDASPLPDSVTAQLQFLDSNPAARLVGSERQSGTVNYLLGSDPAGWRTSLPTYAGLRYEQLYPGVDLHYAGAAGSLKGTYLLAPGADPSRIRWRYAGAQAVKIDEASGELRITLAGSQPVTLVEQAPVAWQDVGGRRVPVAASFALAGDGSVSFELGRYDRALPLVVDPTLTYSSYLGGNSADYAYDIAVDAQGGIYVTGATGSTNFPLASPIQSSVKGIGDLFVTKFNPGGAGLAYSTYLGGDNSDVGFGIAVDSLGNAYVTGESWSSDFPVVNAIQPINPGIQQDVIVFKLNPQGSSLVYSTYLGGSNSQTGWDIAVDGSGSAYITGHTLSGGFPVVNPIQAQINGFQDAFVAKVNAAGSALVYSTFLGSRGDLDYGFSIAVDGSGSAYVTGQTFLDGFPVVNALQPSGAGAADAFVSKLNASGTALVYSTYLGGGDNDIGRSIAVDSAGNVYLTGVTSSTNYPTASALQPAKSSFDDAFVTKINAAGSALVYSTYLGGNNQDGNYDSNIAVDAAGHAYVAGNTASTNFPIVDAVQPAYGGFDSDAFVAKFNLAGSALIYSTYLGGSSIAAGLGDYAYGLALDASGNAYVTGYTFAANFPLAGSAFQTSNGGNYDAFVAVINDGSSGSPTPTPTRTPTSTRTPTPVGTPTPIPTVTPSPTPGPGGADFSLSVSPSSQTVSRQSTAAYDVSLTSLNGFSGIVRLSVSGQPGNTRAWFTIRQPTLSAGGSAASRLDVTPRRGAPSGTFTLTVTAAGGGQTHSQAVTLIINP